MDLITIAEAIYAGLAKDLILNSGRALSQKIKIPARELAVDRCVHSALVALLSSAESLPEKSREGLKKVLEAFFDDSHTVQELKALLRGSSPDREELQAIFYDHAGTRGRIVGFDFDWAMDLFEAAFIEAANEEPELEYVIQLKELREQSKLQGEMLATLRELVRYLKRIERKSLKQEGGMLVAQAHGAQQFLRFEIRPLLIMVRLEAPEKPIPVVDVTRAQETQAQLNRAKRRYLEGLSRFCLNLPLSVLGDDTSDDDELTLDKVYIDLDTTIRIKVWDAVKQQQRCVLLGDPGAGKSTFVRNLCALLARSELEDGNYPEGYRGGLLPVFIQLRDLAPKVAGINNFDNLPEDRAREALISVLQQQIGENLRGLDAADFDEHLLEALHRGEIILVLDGLDEVPFGQRERIRRTVNALISRYSPARMIVTCRIRSYTGDSRLKGFQEFTIAALDEKKIGDFVTAWYSAKRNAGKIDAEQESKRVTDLQRGALNLRVLAQNPMMLTSMAIIHYNKHQLPDERVKLYKLVVDILLRRWRMARLGKEGLEISAALSKLLEDDKTLHELAARLGYEAQTTRNQEWEGADIERRQAIHILRDEKYVPTLDVAEEFMDYTDQHSGLLIGHGGEYSKPVSYGFYHRSFQEYLAGCYIVSQWNMLSEIINLSKEGDYWAPTVQFGFEELYYNESRRGELSLKELAYQLCPSSSPATPEAARQILWASNIAVLLGAEAIENDPKFPNGGKVYLERLRLGLIGLVSGALPFHERAEAGRNLAALGALDTLHIQPIYRLRRKGIELNGDEVKNMMKQAGYFDSDWNKGGTGSIHIYELKIVGQDKVIQDYASGLMWQYSGTDDWITYKKAQEYIQHLKRVKFAGFDNWRLPTLEEAMNLMESEKHDGLYLDTVFDQKQRWIWTADRERASRAWGVLFSYGNCNHSDVGTYFVRAVRSRQKS